MKVWKSIKAALYVAVAVLIIIFREPIVENVKYLVGSLMIVYGLEKAILCLVERHEKFELYNLIWGVIEVSIGIITMLLIEVYSSVCVIWAIWAILREAKEVEEDILEFKEKTVVCVLSLIESAVAIVFSVLLMIHPTEHHAMTHIYLLSVELVTAVLFPHINYLIEKKKAKE
ncbi:MAG: hypothetical protein K6F59_00555 [Gammaproteobacteria bacterium]|nr:hypothetical protein [Gammaproteobacteria bacterium]